MKILKVRNLKGYYFIIIPKEIAEVAGISRGDYIWMEAEPGMISIYPIQGFGRHGDKANTNRQNQST